MRSSECARAAAEAEDARDQALAERATAVGQREELEVTLRRVERAGAAQEELGRRLMEDERATREVANKVRRGPLALLW